MSAFKKGDQVRQIVPVIEGIVSGFQIDQETGARLLCVDYADADGNPGHRYFQEDQVELVAPAEAAAATRPVAEESATGAA